MHNPPSRKERTVDLYEEFRKAIRPFVTNRDSWQLEEEDQSPPGSGTDDEESACLKLVPS